MAFLKNALINAHCHLELTNLAGKMPKNKPFYEWLSELRKQVESWTKEDYQASYLKGLELCKEAGTKVVYDVGNQLAEPEFSKFLKGCWAVQGGWSSLEHSFGGV